MVNVKTLKIGEILLEEGVITHQQLLHALQIQSRDSRQLGEILIAEGIISDQQLSRALAHIYKLPFVALADVRVDDSVFAAVPFDVLKKHKVLPVELKGISLTIATSNPLDVEALQEIQYMSGYQVTPAVAGKRDIEEHLNKYAEAIQAAFAARSGKGSADADTAPVVKMVEAMLMKAIKERASDIHLEPMKDNMHVRFRVDGVLYDRPPIDKAMERKFVSRIKILSGMDVADSRRPQDGRMSMPAQFSDYDIRVSTLPNIMGENVVLRILNKSFTRFSFDNLGMDEAEAGAIRKLIQRPYGIILVTGPTGAGKTTTLYSMLNILNNSTRSLITVEDPVEYNIPGVNQTAINNRAGYTFATAIRHILRHDPDVIMVGEIRDMETAEIAIRAALTGHLVLSTLHTNTAAGAIMRLLDMKIEPFLIQSAVIAVIAQRLVRRLCPHCKKIYVPSDDVRERLARFSAVPADLKLAAPGGCDQCFHTGHAGRQAVYELLQVTDKVRSLILKSPSEYDITQAALAQGMRTLRQAGVAKALVQSASLEEVMGITFMEGD